MEIKEMSNEEFINYLSEIEELGYVTMEQVAATNEVLRRLSRLDELEKQVEEFEKHFRSIMDEPCNDEAHCTCVPFLRTHLLELEKENAALKADMNSIFKFIPDGWSMPLLFHQLVGQLKQRYNLPD